VIVAAVQARMSSTRLPGKVLALVAGRPMLWHAVNRLRFARRVDRVIIATTEEPPDAPIRSFAEAHRIPCFAGSELDLIDRLYGAARRFSADALVRVTGDCPLTDPKAIDEMVRAYLCVPDGVDCVVTNTVPPTYPDGLDAEIYSLSTLERLWRELEDPFWREWFPLFLVEHRDAFPMRNVAHAVDLSPFRWTVDYEEDLAFVREVYRRLYREGEAFDMEAVLALLRSEPSLASINARYARNEGYALALAARGPGASRQGDG
jgi:spore coat polysaccharide biosynthesis protein SpsF